MLIVVADTIGVEKGECRSFFRERTAIEAVTAQDGAGRADRLADKVSQRRSAAPHGNGRREPASFTPFHLL